MTFVALSMVMGLLFQTPPPPEVRLLLIPGADLSREGLMETERMLATLQPDDLIVRESGMSASTFDACLDQLDPQACLSQTLSEVGATSGEVVLLARTDEDAVTWLCVGRDRRPFMAARQAVGFALSSFIPPADDAVARAAAAACLTYAGHQSGW